MTSEVDVDRVHEANRELYAAIESADLDRMGAVWADGPYAATVICVHPGWPAIQGRAEVLRSWAAIMANTPYIQFFLTDIEVEIAGDVAIATCTENILTGVGGSESESVDDAATTRGQGLASGRAVATNVFRRTPSGWRLWVHHASPVIAPPDLADNVD